MKPRIRGFQKLPHIKISGITIYFGVKDWIRAGDYISFQSLYDLNTMANRRVKLKLASSLPCHHDSTSADS